MVDDAIHEELGRYSNEKDRKVLEQFLLNPAFCDMLQLALHNQIGRQSSSLPFSCIDTSQFQTDIDEFRAILRTSLPEIYRY